MVNRTRIGQQDTWKICTPSEGKKPPESDRPTLGLIILEIDIADWWAKAYPIIEQIAATTGAITGVAIVASAPVVFVKWVRNKIKSNSNNDEYAWVRGVLNNESWNISELSEKFDLTEEQAKNLLKGFGYVWDRQKMLYVASDTTKSLRDIEPKKNPQ